MSKLCVRSLRQGNMIAHQEFQNAGMVGSWYNSSTNEVYRYKVKCTWGRAQIVRSSNARFLRHLDLRVALLLRYTFRERTIHNIRLFRARATRGLEQHNSCDCGEEKREPGEDSDQSYYIMSSSLCARNRKMVEYERYDSSLYTLVEPDFASMA